MRLYVTGGTGLVGSNVIRLARQRNDIEIIAAQYGPAPEWDVDYQLDPLDMADTKAVRDSIRKFRPDAVIHCAAFLDHPQMVQRRAQVWQMTVDANLAFAQTCAEVGARYVFVSSDWVFDGQQPLVDEDSPPFPVNFYGFMKAVCERDIMGVSGLSYGVGSVGGVAAYQRLELTTFVVLEHANRAVNRQLFDAFLLAHRDQGRKYALL